MTDMKRITIAATLGLGFACVAAGTMMAVAQAPSKLHNSKVTTQYLEPKYEQIYLKLKRRQILEELDALLSPVQLKHEITLSVEEGDENCKGPNSYYSPEEYKLRLCYSWFDFLENEASVEFKRNPGEPFTDLTPGLVPGFTRAEVILGGTVGVTLHEMGHAIFHIQGIPRLGREEDAADMIAGFMMMQFGSSVALTTIKGTYNVWHHFNALDLRNNKSVPSPAAEADVHSLSGQRAVNFLCMAYGGDPATFNQLADALLPPVRKPNCANEYHQADIAFRKTVLPDIDQELMKKVRAMKILRPEDFKL
jgi:hypothetical protein